MHILINAFLISEKCKFSEGKLTSLLSYNKNLKIKKWRWNKEAKQNNFCETRRNTSSQFSYSKMNLKDAFMERVITFETYEHSSGGDLL